MADIINLDYETRARANLKTQGLDQYSRCPDAKVLMAAYSINGGKVQHADISRGAKMPSELKEALLDPEVHKWAFNAQFERVMTRRVLGIKTPYNSWRCTMVLAYMLGFAGDLLQIGKQIGLKEDELKDTDGKRLIKMFCVPQRVTKKNPFEWRNELTDPEEWWGFCRYNERDVETEMRIKERLIKYPIMPEEWDLYALDQFINDRGVMIDTDFAQAALDLAERRKPQIIEEMKDITRLQNPNSVAQLVPWLKERGYPFDDVRQDTVKKVIREQEENGVDEEAITVLKARLNSAKNSIAKYKTMIDCAAAMDLPEINLEIARDIADAFDEYAEKQGWMKVARSINGRAAEGEADDDDWAAMATVTKWDGTYDELRDIVMKYPEPESYENWIRVMAALQVSCRDQDEAKEIARDWSMQANNYDESEFEYKWEKGFTHDAQSLVTIGTDALPEK
jgi:hypothetical protein